MLRLLSLLSWSCMILALKLPTPSQFVYQFQYFVRGTPVFNIAEKAYTFFYWFPRKNLPDDSPPIFLKNSSVDFLSWYQIPHNLPPYDFLDEGYPADFFCYGMPGNTLPLRNWDPWGLHQVSPEIVRKYRESEIKHGRLAMLGVTGFILQEQCHPYHQDLGGLVITHMEQLSWDVLSFGGLSTEMKNVVTEEIDFVMILISLCSFEVFALFRNWDVQSGCRYHDQFDDVFGIGLLKSSYASGDYGFDPLKLKPSKDEDFREFLEAELNHGRLAMISFIVILCQEYFFGEPVSRILDYFVPSL